MKGKPNIILITLDCVRPDHLGYNGIRGICELLLKKNLDLVWACETRVDYGSEDDMVNLMYKVGCRGFYVGAEHFSQRMLDIFNKDIQVNQIIRTCENAKKYGVIMAMSLITNHPKETISDKLKMFRGLRMTKPEIVWKNKYRPEYRQGNKLRYPIYSDRSMELVGEGVWYGQRDRL